MAPRKKLIEVALPLEAINIASAREKSIRHGHPSTLHLWWARRPLAACRAVIFASLVDDPDDPDATPEFVEACRRLPRGKNAIANDTPRQRLFDFIELLVQWESTTNEDVLETARELIRLATGGNPPPLLDPFAGGGSIPLEAQRLGLEAHASDLNPVAVMINKALIEIPPRFANMPPVNPRDREKFGGGEGWRGAQGLAADVRYYGEWMRERAWEQIGHLYPEGPNGETVIAWLWARTVKCPNPACGAIMPLISSFELSKKRGKRAWIEPLVDRQSRAVRFEIRTGEGKAPLPPKIGRGAKFRCLVCGEIASDQHIKEEGIAGRMSEQLMAVVTEGTTDRSYYAPSIEHEALIVQAKPLWEPDFEMSTHPQYMAPPRYGMKIFADLFTSRQLLLFDVLTSLLQKVIKVIEDDAIARGMVSSKDTCDAKSHADAICTYLALIISKLVVTSNTLTIWRADENKVARAFGRQAVTMNWDYAETNPFSGTAGDILVGVDGAARVLENLRIGSSGTSRQANAMVSLGHKGLVVSTDPPYYDNVPYADLSDFFYVWLRHGLRGIYPEVFETVLTPKDTELVADHQRFGSRETAEKRFEEGLQRSFENVRDAVHTGFPLTVYYAFKQYEDDGEEEEISISSTGWETMLEAIIRSGFLITGTWPMRTELTKALKTHMNFLASSIVLVCRPRPSDAPVISRREFINALRREMPAALHELQSGNIAPVDMAQASIGPGMAVYSRYRKVLEANGEALTVRTALQLINQELDAYLAEQEGDVDADTRFAINWFEQYGFREGEFGVADVLARAKNTSVEGVANAGVVIAGSGKVRLLPWEELEAGWDPSKDRRATVWEGTHHLIERLNTHGEDGAARLLVKMSSDLAAEARALAYRLYSVCERKGWADIARDYNALVVSWPRLQELANELRQNQPPEQLGLL